MFSKQGACKAAPSCVCTRVCMCVRPQHPPSHFPRPRRCRARSLTQGSGAHSRPGCVALSNSLPSLDFTSPWAGGGRQQGVSKALLALVCWLLEAQEWGLQVMNWEVAEEARPPSSANLEHPPHPLYPGQVCSGEFWLSKQEEPLE